MKKEMWLIITALVSWLASGPVMGKKTNPIICPSGQCACMTTCVANNCSDGICNPGCYTCSPRVLPFTGKSGVLYILPEGTTFNCAQPIDPREISGNHEKEMPLNYWICLKSFQPVSLSTQNSFVSETSTIYSFSENTAFICATGTSPQKMAITPPLNGLPTEYWACPGSSSLKPIAKP